MHYNVEHKKRRGIDKYCLLMIKHIESPTYNHKLLFVDTAFAYIVPWDTILCWFFPIGHFEIRQGFPRGQCRQCKAWERENGILFRILWYGIGLLITALGIKRCMFPYKLLVTKLLLRLASIVVNGYWALRQVTEDCRNVFTRLKLVCSWTDACTGDLAFANGAFPICVSAYLSTLLRHCFKQPQKGIARSLTSQGSGA